MYVNVSTTFFRDAPRGWQKATKGILQRRVKKIAVVSEKGGFKNQTTPCVSMENKNTFYIRSSLEIV